MAVALRKTMASVEAQPLMRVPEPDDVALVIQAQADGRRFAVLYRRYVDRIYRYCYQQLGSKEAAEDATSVVFSRALAALPSCRPETFRAWLFTIAHNVIISDLRDQSRRPLAALESALELTDHGQGPEAAALAAEEQASLQAVMARLPDEQRRVLELRLAGLNGPEIAQALERSPGSVRITQYRAIGRIRQMLGITTQESGNGE